MQTHVLISSYCVLYVAGRILIQLFVVAKNDDGHVDGAEDGEFVGLLEKSTFALEECAGEFDQYMAALNNVIEPFSMSFVCLFDFGADVAFFAAVGAGVPLLCA